MSETVIEIPYRWHPRPYQGDFWNYMHSDGMVCYKKRALWIVHRRGGKDLTAVNLFAEQSQLRVGTYWHVFPTYAQGKKTIWEGKTKDGRSFLDYFPQEIVDRPDNQEMMLKLKNGSSYQIIGGDAIDRIVGPNPIGVVLSEYALMSEKVWHLVSPILRENDGWAAFISTPRGHNHLYELMELVRSNKKWFFQILTIRETKREKRSTVMKSDPETGQLKTSFEIVKDNKGEPIWEPVVSEDDIEEERKNGIPEEIIQQEYYCSFEASLVGTYYGDAMKRAEDEGRITNVPWEPTLPVYTCWDLGSGDQTVVWFFQLVGLEIHWIDCYAKSGAGLDHYAKILKEKPYAYSEHYAPHDIRVKELGSGETRFETARKLGIRFHIVRKVSIDDRIQATRNIFPKSWFDLTKCGAPMGKLNGLRALKEYHKQYDPDRKCYRETPEHDWASNFADSISYGAMGMKRDFSGKKPPQEKAIDDYSIFGQH